MSVHAIKLELTVHVCVLRTIFGSHLQNSHCAEKVVKTTSFDPARTSVNDNQNVSLVLDIIKYVVERSRITHRDVRCRISNLIQGEIFNMVS